MSNSQKKTFVFFLQVKFLSGWQEPLWYKVEAEKITQFILDLFASGILLAHCTLRNKDQLAIVCKVIEELDFNPLFEIKFIKSFVFFPNDTNWIKFITKTERLFGVDKHFAIRRLMSFIKKPAIKDDSSKKNYVSLQPLRSEILSRLTPQQLKVATDVLELSSLNTFAPSLLHGVTGSGKSQIYLAMAADLLSRQKSVIFLIPEITLAHNFFTFFNHELKNFPNIFAWHTNSQNPGKENSKLWSAIFNQEPILIIGIHQPIFLPIQNLGGIIVDEEHEESYRETTAPYLDTKQLVLLRAQIHKIPVLLGSATPSSGIFFQAMNNKLWNLFSLTERFAAKTAKTTLACLNYQNKPFWLTPILKTKITDRLSKKEQVILFINRRGFATVTKCTKCKELVKCDNCSVSLVLHKDDTERLECHYCGSIKYPPFLCQCGSKKEMRHQGVGTEQVAQVLEKLHPQANILRADKNSISKKDWSTKISAFIDGKYDVLIGTKSVTKGYHFPKVTLVGVLWADLDFSFPDYKATERAVQQMLQVAGRSGRGKISGEVVIQAFEPELLENNLSEEHYLTFLRAEIEARRQLSYPPFSKLIFLQTKNIDAEVALEQIELIIDKIESFCLTNKLTISLIGPARPLVFKQNKLFLQQAIIKIQTNNALQKILYFIANSQKEIETFSFWVDF